MGVLKITLLLYIFFKKTTNHSRGALFTCIVFFFFLASPQGLQYLSFPTRDQTQAPASEAQNPNHWTIREFPLVLILRMIYPLRKVS